MFDLKTEVNGHLVSTVLLPFGAVVDGPYETCIFFNDKTPNRSSEVVDRYNDERTAERKHAEWVESVRSGETKPPDFNWE